MADLLPDWASGILDALNTDTGFDLTGLANSFLGGGSSKQPAAGATSMVPYQAQGFQPLFGPGGLIVNTGTPTPSSPSFGPAGAGLPGGSTPAPSSGGTVGAVSFHSIRDKMFAHLGFRPKRKTVLYLIKALGFAVASAVLGIDMQDALFLFMKRRHGSRRHYVQTMVKGIKRGERFRKQLSHYHVRGLGRARHAPARRRRR
jgi:hypothetical protein